MVKGFSSVEVRREKPWWTLSVSSQFLYFVAFVFAFLLLAFRRPDAFLVPQFYAEDGRCWYLDAHQIGWKSCLIVYGGYLQIYPRLIASLSQLIPMILAPVVFNTVAVATRSAASVFLLTGRFRDVVPNIWARGALAVFVLATPSAWELHATLTNAHFALSLVATLILLAATPDVRPAWRIFDLTMVILSGLSGPFCLLLAPVTWIRYYRQRRNPQFRWLLILACTITFCALTQLTANLLTGSNRDAAPLGASFELLLHILGGRIFFTTLFGEANYLSSINGKVFLVWDAPIAAAATVAGVAFITRAWKQGPDALRLFTTFATLALVAALVSPLVSDTTAQWPLMVVAPHVGGRYWFFPVIAFFVSLVQIAGQDKRRGWRVAASVLLALSPIGMVADWPMDAWVYWGHARAAAVYDQAPMGTRVLIPCAPAEPWKFWITK